MKKIIYAKLLDEEIDVWKPLEAELVDKNKFVIRVDDQEVALKKGDIVNVENYIFSDGTTGLIVKDETSRGKKV